MDKDLYSLIGGTPPIAFTKPTHLSKWNTKKPAEPWVYKPFLHPARGDSLVLNHWVKGSEQDSDDYHFAKFNRVVDIIEYTDEEYDKYLTDTDWSKEETNYLFKLCQQYDLRFPVIADRFEYGSSARTMEDLKDRYYAVNRKLIKVRGGLTHEYNPHVDRQTLLQQYSYDKSKEIERKQSLLKLYQRTKEEIEEEEILFLEAKRMEEYQQVLTTQRDQLYSTLHLEQAQQIPSTPLTPIHATSAAAAVAAAGHISPTAGATSSSSLSGSAGSVNLSSHVSSSSTAPLSHLKSPTSSTASHSNPGGISIAGGTSGSQDQKKKKKDESVKKARRISTSSSMEDLLPPPPERKDKLIPGVIVRSQKLPGVKATMQAKVLRAMADFGIGPRPIMPTQDVCYKYEHLQNSVLYLLETKKSAEKLNIDTKNIGRKHSLPGSSNTNRPNGDRRRKIG